MRLTSFMTLSLLLLGACHTSAPNNGLGYGQLENDRAFGVIVSQKQLIGSNPQGIVNSVSQAGQVVQSASNSWLSYIPFTGSSNNTDSTTLTIQYVVDVTNGNRVTINQAPALNEPILYPGQKALIQNNNGYIRVLQADVERQHED